MIMPSLNRNGKRRLAKRSGFALGSKQKSLVTLIASGG